MKNLLNIIAVVCMTLSLQANNSVYPSVEHEIIVPSHFFANMSIKSIQADLPSRHYFMTGSFTVIKTPTSRDGDVAKTVDVSFKNSPILSRKGSNYIQANAKAKRNDNNRINEFRIYVHHDGGTQGNIDKRNIKVNWKTGSLEVVDKLKNVTVLYQQDGILIIGTMQKNGYTIGVSLVIAKDTRLI